MKAYIQPSFGFPGDLIPVAYVIIVLSNGERFEISENSTGETIQIKTTAMIGTPYSPLAFVKRITDNEE